MDDWGRVTHDLQRSGANYAFTVTATEAPPYLYISSLRGHTLGRLDLGHALASVPSGEAAAGR